MKSFDFWGKISPSVPFVSLLLQIDLQDRGAQEWIGKLEFSLALQYVSRFDVEMWCVLLLAQPTQRSCAIFQQIPSIDLTKTLMTIKTILQWLNSNFVGQVKGIMLEPTLIESQEWTLVILMINFHLLACQLLNRLIIFLAFEGESNLFNVIEDPFKLVEADEILMPFLMN